MYRSYPQPKKSLSFDDVCELLTVSYTEDDIGQQIAEYTPRKVFCVRYSVSRQEFYQAKTAGIRSEILVCIPTSEYKGEEFMRYNGAEYTIYKVYEREDEAVELYCAKRVGQ